MTTTYLVFLAGTLAANPLPDNKVPIDSLTYTFGEGGGLAGGGGRLTITKEGKVSYSFSSHPFTGSGGRVVQTSWELSKEERNELFRKLVDGGLLEAEDGDTVTGGIRVTSGRWRATLAAEKVPDKAMAHLRPLLTKADPVKWPEKKAVAAKNPPAKPGTLTTLIHHFMPKKDGDYTSLVVSRDGKVYYVRHIPGPAEPVKAEWTIPAKDAEALLDGLVADGLFELEDVGRDKYPGHTIDTKVGRWQTTFHVKELPEKLSRRLLPLLRKADAEFWK